MSRVHGGAARVALRRTQHRRPSPFLTRRKFPIALHDGIWWPGVPWSGLTSENQGTHGPVALGPQSRAASSWFSS